MSSFNPKIWRLLDTETLRAAENFAYNKTLLEGHQKSISPHTLRFLQFKPSALVGFHQAVSQEIKIDYCRSHGIDIQRRITGGGALFFDSSVLGWELYLDKITLKTADMTRITSRICGAVANGIASLGVQAKFRPRNDIEIDGKKISGTGGAFDGDSILYQGTLLIDFDLDKMLKVLHIPAEKFKDKGIASARDRITSLQDHLKVLPPLGDIKEAISQSIAEEFSIRYDFLNQIDDVERTAFDAHLKEIDSPDWVYQHERPFAGNFVCDALLKTSGGLLRASLAYDPQRKLIKQVWLTGDFFIKPRRIILDLEAYLKDTPLKYLSQKIDDFFVSVDIDMLLITPRDFKAVILKAIQVNSDEEHISV